MARDPKSTTSGRPGSLRAVLSVALVVLVATSVIIQFTKPGAKAAAAPPKARPPVAHHSSSPTSTTVPGAVTGSVTLTHAAAPCGLSIAGATPPSTKGGAHATATAAPVGHCTVLEIGDSMGNDIGWGIQRHLTKASGLTFVQDDKSSTGLVNTSFYDWPSQLAADLKTVHPQLVVICLGGNDEQGIALSSGPVQFPTPAWKVAYLARVRQLVHLASAAGAYVVWIGMPIMQQPTYSAGMATLNALYQQGTTSEPNATFVPTWSLFANPAGAFQNNAEVNGTATTLRESDGIHYSFAGEDVIATYMIRELALVFHVKLTPTTPAVITGWK